jgi:chitinase
VTIRSGRHTKRAAIAVALLLAALVVIVSVIAGGGGSKPARPQAAVVGASPGTVAGARPWFAPYVDLTLSPVPRFQSPAGNPSGHVVLGFVLGGAGDPCTPAWGGVSTLDQAATLGAQITEAQAAHEQVLVSFGGAQGSDLAVGCTDLTKLEGAYQAVIAHYSLNAIDLDVEGPASLNPTVAARRAEAIAAVQRGRVTAGEPLAVWLTLTVSPSGLEPSGVAALQQMLLAGVKLAGVNVMAFDYGPLAGRTVLSASESGLTATAAQLQRLYRSNHIRAGPDGVWSQLGATIMEGRTDTAGQVWDMSDARALYEFAFAHHLGRLSEWSLGRDQPCSGAPPQPSGSCSGVAQQPLEFAQNLLGRAAR